MVQLKFRRRAVLIFTSMTAMWMWPFCFGLSITVSGGEYDAVLRLRPVGYWPLDEGNGKIIYDRSVNANHGAIHHVEWDREQKLLDFKGRYQWLEISKNKAYRTPAFTMGGWVFLRSDVWGSGWSMPEGVMLFGNKFIWQTRELGLKLCIRHEEVIDVVSGGKEDVLGTRLLSNVRNGIVRINKGKPNLDIGQWHHLLYAFEPDSGLIQGKTISGTGKLYLNGTLIASRNKIPYEPADVSLQIGIDALWWHQQIKKSGSLDGSARSMVWFDRSLSDQEVQKLYQVTRPAQQPPVYDETMVVLNGLGISAVDLPDLDSKTLRSALELYAEKPEGTVKKMSFALLPTLKESLSRSMCRLPAAQILVKINDDASRAVLAEALPGLMAAIQAEGSSAKVRAEAVLALAAMKEDAELARPLLTETLSALLDREGVRLPHVEDLLRNALIRALWDIGSNDAEARRLVDRAFTEPLQKTVDLSKDHFFSFKELGPEGDYTATAYYKGITYKVGEGIAWRGVEKVSVDEYEAIVAELRAEYPGVETWRKSTYEHLYRVPVTKIYPDGREQVVYLEGKNFVLDGHDAKCRGWTIFVDELGYIHLTGGQHNTPNPDFYIPGSWEKLGIGRNRNRDDFPRQMYWVSAQPESIDSFEFVGQRDNSRAMPADYLNYMQLLQSPEKKTFLYGRIDAYGWQSSDFLIRGGN